MPEGKEQPVKLIDRRDRRIYVWWAAGFGFLLLVALICWGVFPIWWTRHVVLSIHESLEVIERKGGQLNEVDEEELFGKWGVGQLGGPVSSSKRVGRYLHMSDRLAPQKHLALGILSRCGSSGAGPLAEALHSPDILCRRWAAKSLAYIGPEAQASVPALADALGDSDETVRSYAAYALAQIGPTAAEALPALVVLFENEDVPDTQMSDYAYPKFSVRESRWASVRAMGQIDREGKVVLPTLLKALAHRDNWVRAEAARALGEIGPASREHAGALEKLSMTDEDYDVRLAAARAYWSLTGDVEKPLAAVLVMLNKGTDLRGKEAVELIMDMGALDERTIPILTQYLDRPGNSGFRASVARALGRAGPAASRAIPALEKLSKSNDWAASAAAEALKKIRGEEPPK